MKLYFEGDVEALKKGIEIFSEMYGFQVSANGICIEVEKCGVNRLEAGRKDGRNYIRYYEKVHFFRALGLFLEHFKAGTNFEIAEIPQFVTNGVMIDVSQGNSVLKVDSIKRLLNHMAVMGLNMAMIYTEDNYVVEGEPYFGYMRGRYTGKELKECDDYAYELGIEMIPCIQTLAHLIDALKWECYADMKDDDDTLLVGDEKVYAFIEKMVAAAGAPFRTKRIHIGMDEAWKLGQGNYLLKNGYKSKFDIMTGHLAKVLEITMKYGLKPMIWSDMYFRAASETGSYYDRASSIPERVTEKVPRDVQLVYWDYYHKNREFYTEWIKRHRQFGSEPVFAGGIWSWNGYAVDYEMTFDTTNAALEVCKQEKVKEVFVTIWGDGGTESNIYSNLLGLQLFAEHGYAEKLEVSKLKSRFRFCTGCDYDDFMSISKLDVLPGVTMPDTNSYNPCKFLMWQDPMMGLFDKNMEGFRLEEYYADLEKLMQKAASNNGDYGFIFEFLGKLCSVLSIKSELGLRLVKAYRDGDRNELLTYADTVLPELAKRIESLRVCNRELWHQANLPFGWEVLDIRYGGLLARIDSAGTRLRDFSEGRIEKLEELEEERLYFAGEPGPVMCLPYSRMPSASRLTFCTGF